MGRPERVILAFRALGKTAQASALPQSSDPIAPSGQDLVRVGLVANVPDDAIGRRVENIVERDRQFDYAEAGAEMTASHRNRADCFGAQLVDQLSEIALSQLAQIGGRPDLIQKRGERLSPFCPQRAALLVGPTAASTPTPSLTSAAIMPWRHWRAAKSTLFDLG